MKRETNKKKKSHKKLWIILGITAVIIVVLVLLAVRGIQNMTEQLNSMMNNTATAELGEIEVNTEGIGVIETANTSSSYLDYNVTLKKLYKSNGEKASSGEVIAEFDSAVTDETISALKDQLAQLDSRLTYASKNGDTYVDSPVSGRVKRIWAEKGDSVLTVMGHEGALAEISADGMLRVRFNSDQDLVQGQNLTILYGDTSITGTIRKITGTLVEAVFEDSDSYQLGTEVKVTTEEGTELGSGVVESGHSIFITAGSGNIKSILVNENEKVSAGSSIFRLEKVGYSQEYLTLLEQREELSRKVKTAEAYQRGYVLTADSDCIVSELNAKEGDQLLAGTVFCKLLDTGSYQVVLDIDELDIKGIEEEQPVEVTVDAIPDTVYQGTVTGISLAGDNENGVGTYQVKVQLSEGENLLPGMSANGKITISHKKDALLVPIDTIQTKDGEKTVTVIKEDGTTESRKVTLGLVSNDYGEILEGVEEGENLQVIVKLEDIYSQMGITMDSTQE